MKALGCASCDYPPAVRWLPEADAFNWPSAVPRTRLVVVEDPSEVFTVELVVILECRMSNVG